MTSLNFLSSVLLPSLVADLLVPPCALCQEVRMGWEPCLQLETMKQNPEELSPHQ